MPARCKMYNIPSVDEKSKNTKPKLFLDSVDDAMRVVEDTLSDTNFTVLDKTKEIPNVFIPSETSEPIWEVSLDAAKRTLEYIFKVLYHTCYLLAVKGGKPTLYKLRADGIPNFYKEEIKKAAATNPEFKIIEQKISTLRILQCLVKGRGEEEQLSSAYNRFFREYPLQLPTGVYILNLTDAVLLRKDGKTPWGQEHPYSGMPMLPILGGSSAVGYYDIPIPNYDDVLIATGRTKLGDYELDWNKKKPKAVFRGSPSGCGTHEDTNMRIRIAEMVAKKQISPDLLDAGITRVSEGGPRFDPIYGLSVLQTSVTKIGFMNLVEQSKHKYMVHIDGNVAAYRLLHSMMTGSVQLKVKGKYTMWLDHFMKDGVHYVGVAEDLSDLEEKIQWCIAHDKECEEISKNAYELAKMALEREFIEQFFLSTLNTIILRGVNIQSPDYFGEPNYHPNFDGGQRPKCKRKTRRHKRRTTRRKRN
jgi:hypothetical protein